jgi:hypothetical protein
MVDPGSLVTVSLTSDYVLANFPDKVCMFLLMPESVILLDESLYAEAIEAVKSRAALSPSSSELIWILGEINSKTKL